MAFLKWEDYVIFVITLVLSLGIGLYNSLRGTKQTTSNQYILGDGKMWTFPVALSLMVTYESGIMLLGVPAEVYMYGMQWLMSVIGFFVSHMVALHLFIPSLKKLNITSINQYYELRYNSHGLRLFVTILKMIGLVKYLGSVIFIPSITLGIVADIPMEISIITLTVVVLVYTIIGGFTAVIWTDVFQAVLMFGGMLAIIIKGTMEAGGPTNTWRIVREKGRFNMLDFDPDPTLRQSFWSLFVGSLITGARLEFAQPAYQRIKATPTVKTAKRMVFTPSVLFLLVSVLAVSMGAVMFAYFDNKGCDPLVSKQVRNANQLMAKMLPEIFHDTPGLPGIFLAALFSASLSTMSSLFSGLSAMFLEDIVKPHTKPMSDKKAIRIAQLSVLAFGVLAIMSAFAVSSFKGPIPRILDVTSACSGAASFGIMLIGWLMPTVNSFGALIGGLVSFLFVGWISLGKLLSPRLRDTARLEPASTENCPRFNISGSVNATEFGHVSLDTMWNGTNIVEEATQASIAPGPQGVDVLYSLSYKWLMPLGVSLVLIIGPIVSRLQAQKPVDPSLVVPLSDYLYCCVPEKVRRILGWSVKRPGKDEETIEDEPDVKDELVSAAKTNLNDTEC